MDKTCNNLESELDDLRHELENFQKEKERVRGIVGKIGGVPRFQTKLINFLFLVLIVFSLVISVTGGEKWRLMMVELALVAMSLKIIYLMDCQMKMNHFKFWILSSIEWRINEMAKQIRPLKRD
jgi:hypothetical protein